ncbi:DHH family phosphoesterase [Couchioplanes azureus]|uniref:exopolyphosphatase n=1 Tax=Couchioplanes caeruleus TaxID=56438 RepID=UPI0016702629|nr:exopolyphosphatase [Couchioplanes caeruleus]GGQ62464.1 exopolyphosphatase [Couchioplanes caeruleus subsp. azureus]
MKYRLVTRSDMDGLVCAVLLKFMNVIDIDDIKFVHPKDVQDGTADITDRDILTNLPYHPKAHLVFDHHHSETLRNTGNRPNHIINAEAPSAARVIFEYYGGAERFPEVPDDLMRAVDQADSADYTIDDILNPTGWTLLNFIMDSRTGLGRFREFRVANFDLMRTLIDACIQMGIEEILKMPDVAERVDMYRDSSELFVEQLKRVSRMEGDVVVVDLREEDTIFAGNRFMVYALFPEARVSMHIIWGFKKQNTVFACGKSILDRSSPVDIGSVMLRYGGGGHLAAGTCQVAHEDAERAEREIIEALKTPRTVSV